jgi:hypothetical protein
MLPFDAGDDFSFDKAGGEPCRHLDASHACTIHDALEERGFGGCVKFDCYGAGQRVVQEVFDGKSWRDDPALIKPMSEAFYRMRAIHDLLILLRETRRLPLERVDEQSLDALVGKLTPAGGWSQAALVGLDLKTVRSEVYDFLASLKRILAPRGDGARD